MNANRIALSIGLLFVLHQQRKLRLRMDGTITKLYPKFPQPKPQ